MWWWAAMFLVVALFAAVFGFSSISQSAAAIGRVVFFVFITLFVVSIASDRFRGGRA
jgi:uncharacterized membrane protein YtjA (UPF0391 family)